MLHLLNPSQYFPLHRFHDDAQVLIRFIVSVRATALPDDDSAEGTTNAARRQPDQRDLGSGDEDQPPAKKQKLSGVQRKKLVKEEKKKNRGANKGRKFGKVTDEVELCWKLASGLDCEFGEKWVDIHKISYNADHWLLV